jgi:AcrR family transcriptional regulator
MKRSPPPARAKRSAKPERTVPRAKRGIKRMRLSPEARSDLILRGAIRFFAERGFQGQTRDLAEQLGISTGLLFRYFPTKDALIDRIYETLFEGRWKPEWDEILGNRSRDLRERLIEFYLDYSQMLHDYEWGPHLPLFRSGRRRNCTTLRAHGDQSGLCARGRRIAP